MNEAFVRRYLSGSEPGAALGRRLQSRSATYVIVGVARNSLYNAFGEAPTPIIYLSYRDRPLLSGEIHVRPRSGSEASVAPDIRRIIRTLDPDLPIFNVRTLSDHVETNLVFRRVPARLFAILGPLCFCWPPRVSTPSSRTLRRCADAKWACAWRSGQPRAASSPGSWPRILESSSSAHSPAGC